MRTVLVLLLAAAAVRAEPVDVGALARPLVEDKQVVGMTIGLRTGRDADPVFHGFGRVKLGGAGAPDADTVYEIGSISKVFTGILLAQLAADGTVRLDQPVAELMPEGAKAPAKITLRHLATHSSGLPRMPPDFLPKDFTNPYADYDAARLFASLARIRPAWTPGSRYAYSNYGTALLGQVLARKADTTYAELVRARIAGPLGMKDTGIALDEDRKGRLAPGHRANRAPTSNWDLAAFAGAGGIRSTARDMMKFLAADGPAYKEARKIHARAEGGPPMGLGWHLDGDVRWHNGQTGGYHSYAAVHPETGAAVVILANTATGDVDPLGVRLIHELVAKR